MSQDNDVQIEQRRVILDDFFKVEEAVVRYRRFDGEVSEPVRRLSLERGDSVAALLLDVARQRVVLVEQFKYPTLAEGSGWIVETVAGMIDGGEDAETAVRREVQEEVGYTPLRLEPVATFYVSPGGSSERVFLYIAEVSESAKTGTGGGLAGEGEDIRTREYSLVEAFAALDAGAFCDAKTIIAIQWLRRRIEVTR